MRCQPFSVRVVMSALLFACAIVSGARAEEKPAAVRIQPWAKSPFYWQYKGEPVLLLGGSDEDNLFNNPALMRANFATMERCGANYIRCTLSCRDEGDVWPFARSDGKYDLERFNPEFWRRLETCVREAEKRDVIVQIEFWATFDYYRDIWERNPFNPVNNVNYTVDNTRLKAKWPHHPARRPQPFVFSVPEKNDDRVLLKYQQRFVRKVLDVTLPYANVLYCLDNETRAPGEWAWYWARFIREEVAQRGTTIQLTEMWDAWDLRGEEHARTYKHAELFSFVDVSQNNWQVGQTHYDRLMGYRRMLKESAGGIRPMNNVKVYHRQGGGRPSSAAISIDRWWQNVFAGCASTRFHRPDGGIGLDGDAQQVIRAARAFFAEFDIFRAEPQPESLSDRDANEAYCLALGSERFALYFPNGGAVRLAVGSPNRRMSVRWFDPNTAQFRSPVQLTAEGGTISLESPAESRNADATRGVGETHSPAWLAVVE